MCETRDDVYHFKKHIDSLGYSYSNNIVLSKQEESDIDFFDYVNSPRYFTFKIVYKKYAYFNNIYDIEYECYYGWSKMFFLYGENDKIINELLYKKPTYKPRKLIKENMMNINSFNEFITEKKKYKLSSNDMQQYRDFTIYVKNNYKNEPNLLRAFYDRTLRILEEIRNNNVKKEFLSQFFNEIYRFIEGYDENIDINKKDFQSTLPNEYDKLIQIINQYNQLVNKYRSKNGRINDNTVFNIRAWKFDKESIQKLTESKEYEKYCDFGCNYYFTYIENNPDIDCDEFFQYVCDNNKACRDSGEIQDISKNEIERLGKEYKEKNL